MIAPIAESERAPLAVVMKPSNDGGRLHWEYVTVDSRRPRHNGADLSHSARSASGTARTIEIVFAESRTLLILGTYVMAPNDLCFSGGCQEEPSGRAVHRPTSGRGRALSNGVRAPVRLQARVRWHGEWDGARVPPSPGGQVAV